MLRTIDCSSVTQGRGRATVTRNTEATESHDCPGPSTRSVNYSKGVRPSPAGRYWASELPPIPPPEWRHRRSRGGVPEDPGRLRAMAESSPPAWGCSMFGVPLFLLAWGCSGLARAARPLWVSSPSSRPLSSEPCMDRAKLARCSTPRPRQSLSVPRAATLASSPPFTTTTLPGGNLGSIRTAGERVGRTDGTT